MGIRMLFGADVDIGVLLLLLRKKSSNSLRGQKSTRRGSRAIISRAIAPSARAQMQSKVSWDAAPWAGGGRPGPPDIYGIGMNFLSHAKELGKDPPVAPLVFPKATSSFNTGRFLVLPGRPDITTSEGTWSTEGTSFSVEQLHDACKACNVTDVPAWMW